MMAYIRASFIFEMRSKMANSGNHFSRKKKTDVEHVLNHLSDMHLPMLFKFGTQIMNDGLHMHVSFFLKSDPRWPTGGHFFT